MKTKLSLPRILLQALLIGALSAPQYLAAATATEPISPYANWVIPVSKNGVEDIDRKWSPPEVITVINTTTCSNPFDGEGMVVGICGIGTTRSDYVSIRDTSTVNSGASTDIAWYYAVYIATTDAIAARTSCAEYPDGIKFSTGIAVCANGSGTSFSVRYRRLKRVP